MCLASIMNGLQLSLNVAFVEGFCGNGSSGEDAHKHVCVVQYLNNRVIQLCSLREYKLEFKLNKLSCLALSCRAIRVQPMPGHSMGTLCV